MRQFYLLLSFFTAISVSTLSGVAAAPHVIIILVDDMGYGDAGCYNSASKIDTPHIDRLAEEGMRFTDAHAPGPLCHMSRYGLMTGTYPFRTNVNVWPKQPVIKSHEDTVAKLLSRAGYQTAMVGKWHLGFLENGYENPLPGGPVDQGFHSFFGIRASTDIPPYFYIRDDKAVQPPTNQIGANATEGWSPIQGKFWREGGIAPNLDLEDVTPRFTEEAIEVIKNRDDSKPLFLYLAYPSPHTPWLPGEKFEKTSEAGLYGDFMTMVDDEIGKVLTAMEEAGMKGDSLVIFTSDNGPVWCDEDADRLGHDSCGQWRGMKADAWEAGHRMPFIVRWPGTVEEGTVTEKAISFTDILATLADLSGQNLLENGGADSFSFLSTLKGEEPKVRPPIVMKSGGGFMTIRSGDWKLIEGLGSGGFSHPKRIEPETGGLVGQLYDLGADPGETENLFSAKPDVVERLRAEMKSIVGSGGSR